MAVIESNERGWWDEDDEPVSAVPSMVPFIRGLTDATEQLIDAVTLAPTPGISRQQ